MKNILFAILLISNLTAFSQDEDAIVYFNAKPNSAAFFANPLIELSARSLARRTTQNIALDITDAPMSSTFISQIEAANGVTVLAKSKWLNCVYVRGPQSDILALSSLSFVQNVKFLDASISNRKIYPKAEKFVKSRPVVTVNATQQPNSVFNYGNSFNQINQMNGEILHQ